MHQKTREKRILVKPKQEKNKILSGVHETKMPGVPLTVEQRVFLVTKYFDTKKLSEVGRLFTARYPNRSTKLQFGTK